MGKAALVKVSIEEVARNFKSVKMYEVIRAHLACLNVKIRVLHSHICSAFILCCNPTHTIRHAASRIC